MVIEDEPHVVQAQCVQDRGVQVVHVKLVRGGVETRYRLYDGSGEGWEPIEDGWSVISLAPESVGNWLFGY